MVYNHEEERMIFAFSYTPLSGISWSDKADPYDATLLYLTRHLGENKYSFSLSIINLLRRWWSQILILVFEIDRFWQLLVDLIKTVESYLYKIWITYDVFKIIYRKSWWDSI